MQDVCVPAPFSIHTAAALGGFEKLLICVGGTCTYVVQPSYTLSGQNHPLASLWACLVFFCHFDCWTDSVDYEQLLH